MSILISDGTTTLTLTSDLYWSDEFTWTPVQQVVEPTITGSQVVQTGSLVSGRAITLAPPDESSGWIKYTDVAQLRAWSIVAGQELTVTIRGTPYTAIFRHQDGALEVNPVAFFSDRDGNDYCLVTIRLMEIE